MCRERRVTIGVQDMSGPEPKRTISISLDSTRFYAGLIGVVVVVLGSAFAAWAGAVGWVTDQRIADELKPPAGTISKAITQAVGAHAIETQIEGMKADQENERRLLRVEWMIEQVFTRTTDLPLPDPVGE